MREYTRSSGKVNVVGFVPKIHGVDITMRAIRAVLLDMLTNEKLRSKIKSVQIEQIKRGLDDTPKGPSSIVSCYIDDQHATDVLLMLIDLEMSPNTVVQCIHQYLAEDAPKAHRREVGQCHQNHISA